MLALALRLLLGLCQVLLGPSFRLTGLISFVDVLASLELGSAKIGFADSFRSIGKVLCVTWFWEMSVLLALFWIEIPAIPVSKTDFCEPLFIIG